MTGVPRPPIKYSKRSYQFTLIKFLARLGIKSAQQVVVERMDPRKILRTQPLRLERN